jgi:HEAT repeat protein
VVVALEGADSSAVSRLAATGGYYGVRSGAVRLLAEKWPDQTTRDLLAQRAVRDDNEYTRSAALQALAEKWPDQSTRDLLAQRAVQDDNEYTRSAALQSLAEKWPDQTTRDFLAQRIVKDPDISFRGAAFFALAKTHSEFGRILPTCDLDGSRPYLDPLEPISRKHIEEAAVKVGISPEDIETQVASLSTYLGWDVTGGAKKTGRSKSGRKLRN